MSLLMRNATRHDPLRRRLRAEHRRPLRRPGKGAAGRLVLLRQRRRGAQGRGRDERPPGRPHLVGPATTGARPTTMPAVVGSFPEPFLNGIGGKRCRCASNARSVQRRRLPHGHGPAARARRARRRRRRSAAARRARDAARRSSARGRHRRRRGPPRIEEGPRASGVYARFSRRRQHAHAARRTGRGRAHAGRRRRADRGHAPGEDAPVWVVTGTDAAGVERPPSSATACAIASRSPCARRRRSAGAGRRSASLALPRRRRSEEPAMFGGLLFYRRLASPLHADPRERGGAVWALALMAAALFLFHPLVPARAAARGPRRRLRAPASARSSRGRCAPPRSWRCRSCASTCSSQREGLTVFARLGDLGPFGQGDLTVEALVYGCVIALKVTLLILVTTLAGLAVDPDELLPGLPPALVSLRAHRLARDADDPAARGRRRSASPRRSAPARRRAPAARARRVALLGAVVGGSLDRAMDVAATLEVRGFATAAPRQALRRGQCSRARWSRHDIAFALLGARDRGARVARPAHRRRAPFQRLPAGAHARRRRHARAVRGAVAVALLPFCDRRGIEPMSARSLSFERVTYRYPGRGGPALQRRQPRDPARASSACSAGLSGHGKSTLLRAACGLVPHFHGGRFAGRVRVCRARHARARARRGSAPSRARCSRTPRRSS